MINIKEKIQKIHSFSYQNAKECEKLILRELFNLKGK